MTSLLTPGSTIVFTGDSVTDSGRRDDPQGQLGQGYVRAITQSPLSGGVTIINTGISGDRVVDLERRWVADVLNYHADLVSILIGVNETWRRYDSDDPTSAEQYERGYRRLLDPVAESGSRLVLIEPFVLPVSDAQRGWRADLDLKIDVVRRLAAEYEGVLVPADAELTRQAASRDTGALAADGVHPTALGHELLASLWLETVTSKN
jgi:lysophospholipase L1-like esterase